MKKITKKTKVLITLIIFAVVLTALPFWLYLKVLPWVISDEKAISFVEQAVKESANLDLKIKNPELKTELSPLVKFKLEEVSLVNGKENLLTIKNLDTAISLKKIFQKSIILNKITLDNLFIDANKLMALSPTEPQKETPSFDWNIEWIDSLFSVKDTLILYNLDKTTHVKISAKNMEIAQTRNPKNVRFNIIIDILKNTGKTTEKVKLSLCDKNKVYIQNKKLFIDDAELSVNNSKVILNAVSDQKNNFDMTVYSNKFAVENVIELLETNLVIPDADIMLSFFKDIKGSFDFKIKMTNKSMNGTIKLNNASLKLVYLNDLPVFAESGSASFDDKKIKLNDFKGYYGNSKINHIEFFGTVDDYMKSVDTNIEAKGIATNDLMKNYVSKAIGCPLELKGNAPAKILIKSKYNKIDITSMFKIAKGDDILVGGVSLTPKSHDRAVKADMHLVGNKLNIESIKYFIAEELNKNTKNVKPILTIDGNMDIATLEVKNLGFNIPKPLPSEFLNLFAGPKMFKKGTISGHMQMVNDKGTPRLDGKLEMKKVRIPSQRLSIKEATLTTDKKSIKVDAYGRFKKSDYDFTGKIKNELLFPIIVQNVSLVVDNINVDRMIQSMNQQPAITSTEANINTETIVNAIPVDEDSDDDLYIFPPGLLIVENCVLEVVKGFYKDIKFGNLKADLTLDKNGLFQIKSNKFDFAQGISTLKVLCDLNAHKYSIRLGVKNIDSDLIATTLLALPREISGKAMGLIELNTDDSLKMNGRIRFDVSNGTIQKIGLVEYGLKFAALFRNPMAMISPSTIVDLVNIPEGKFEKINGDLVIKDNVIEKIMIKSSAAQLSSFIVGRFDLETRDATLRIYTKFSSKNKGIAGFMRNLSLNSLANKVPLSSRNDSLFYSAELSQLPKIEADEKDCQVFLTKVDGDVETFNFLSSLKKIK